MNYVINEGCHYPTPCMGIGLKLFTKQTHFAFDQFVLFEENCKYDIGSDQSDINKLLGFSYGFHHKNSDRIGWRYLIDENKIELMYYAYENGNVIKKSLKKVFLNKPVNIVMIVDVADGMRNVHIEVDKTKKDFQLKAPSYWFTYDLSLYFGGNRRAPHDMVIALY